MGTYNGYQGDEFPWQLIQTTTVNGTGAAGRPFTSLPSLDKPLVISAGSTQAFCITSDISSKKKFKVMHQKTTLYEWDVYWHFVQGGQQS
jgi:hypothetical protein